jgi:type I thyroxine 5'-deiodinase
MESIRSRFADRADFLTVYIKEAHPEDEWQMDVNEENEICYPQPKTLEKRILIANDFTTRFSYRMPLVVDPIDNPADEAYAAWPERLYVIGEDGRVAYKGGTGPFNFNPDELEAWLEENLPASSENVAAGG